MAASVLAGGYVAAPHFADFARALDRYRKPLELHPTPFPATTVADAPHAIEPQRETPLVFDTSLPDHLPPPRLSRSERDCLAETVLKFAGTDTIAAQIAVAQVVMRRAAASKPQTDVCSLVRSEFGVVQACARATCRDAPTVPLPTRDKQTLRRSQAHWVADDVAAGRAWLRELADATYFRRVDNVLDTGSDITEVGRIGRLVFYWRLEDLAVPLFPSAEPAATVEVPVGSSEAERQRKPSYATVSEERELPQPKPSKEAAAGLKPSEPEGPAREGRVVPTVANGAAAATTGEQTSQSVTTPSRRSVRTAASADAVRGDSEKASASRAALMRALEASR